MTLLRMLAFAPAKAISQPAAVAVQLLRRPGNPQRFRQNRLWSAMLRAAVLQAARPHQAVSRTGAFCCSN